MCKTIFKLVGLCVLFNVAVFALQPSPFPFGILTGLLVGAAFIVGNNEGIDHTWSFVFDTLKDIEEKSRQVIEQNQNVKEVYMTEDKKHV